MEIIGADHVVELTREDEWHHATDGHEHWQESVVLCWWDFSSGVGGYHRIGHQPFHHDGGKAHITNNFFTPSCVYKRCEILSLRECDCFKTGYGCGDESMKFEFSDHAIWTFAQPEVSGQLHVTDYHTPLDIYPRSGDLFKKITAGHMEVGGSVRGALTIDGKRYEIDGLAFRDHGWGTRAWDIFVAHRWVAGTFGPDLTVLGISILDTGNNIANFGCLVRGDKLIYADKVDIITYLEHDALTHRGGHLRMSLATGERVDIEIEPLQKGVVSWMHDTMAVTDTMCKLTYGDRTGMCNFEISNNSTRGRTSPSFASNGFLVDGLHRL